VNVDVDKLTRMLAGRLAAIVPVGFHVKAADGMLWYSADDGRFPGQSGTYQVGRSGTDVRASCEGSGPAAGDSLAGVAAMALDRSYDGFVG